MPFDTFAELLVVVVTAHDAIPCVVLSGDGLLKLLSTHRALFDWWPKRLDFTRVGNQVLKGQWHGDLNLAFKKNNS
jgi:hypothetical protein